MPGPSKEDMQDIQGDVWPGLGKSHETFYLFSISKPDEFKKKLNDNKDIITSAEGAFAKRKQNRQRKQGDTKTPVPSAGINVSFSPKGMERLRWNEATLPGNQQLGDRYFKVGASTDAFAQGRDDANDFEGWMKDHVKFQDPKNQATPEDGTKVIHGVFLVCGTKETVADAIKSTIEPVFGDSIHHIHSLEGDVRTGDNHGYEHFGFKDTISQPRLDGWEQEDEKSLPYKCRPGIIVMNHPGTNGEDEDIPGSGIWEPEWAKNGSYLVLRKMEQDVAKFKEATEKIANDKSLGLNLKTPEEVGARFVGRWQSGAPVEWHPTRDPAKHSEDKQWDYGNNWEYKHPDQELRCPFGSHIRKSNPRNTFGQGADDKDLSLIMRRGIPFGSDYSEQTKNEQRGLLFACYQSSVTNGYSCLMNRWINTDGFPFPNSGQDAVVAQPIKGAVAKEDQVLHSNFYGLDENGKPYEVDANGKPPTDKKKRVDFPSFVKIRGGEYFFTPPISLFGRLVEGVKS